MKKTPLSLRVRIFITCMMAVSVMLLWHSSLSAQSLSNSAKVISYQGTLQTSSGQPLTGNHLLTITLYDDEFGRSPFWSGNYMQSLDKGVFTALLGSGEYPLPEERDLSHQVWVGVRVDNGEELRPLTMLTGSPYSLSVMDGAITKEKIKADYVGSIEINGQKVTGNGTTLNIKSGSGVDLLYDETSHSLSFNSSTGIGSGAKPQFIANNPCSTNNDDGSPFNTIGGGCGNTTILPGAPMSWFSTIAGGFGNTANDNYSVVAGGNTNTATAPFSAIVGGHLNNAFGCGSFVGGGGAADCDSNGTGNTAIGTSSAIVGGDVNLISTGSDFSFIGAGNSNTITSGSISATIGGGASHTIGNTAASHFAFIGGGSTNAIDASIDATIGAGIANNILNTSDQSAIIGGSGNSIDNSVLSVVGGGETNRIFNTTSISRSSILGGSHNTINASTSTIGGGLNNSIPAGSNSATIAGGESNATLNNHSTVGGGISNQATGENSVVAGGSTNTASAQSAAIVGGSDNVASAITSFVGGGNLNMAGGQSSTIAGGEFNDIIIGSDRSSIGGGDNNIIWNATDATVGGGSGHDIGISVNSNFGFIGGGNGSDIDGSTNATIGGGLANEIQNASDNASILGGDANHISNTLYGTIGGGQSNLISNETSITHSSILGGDHNTIQSSLSSIEGGQNNTIDPGAEMAVIVGGHDHHITGSISNSTIIGGGSTQTINSSEEAGILAGENNLILLSHISSVTGGSLNTIVGVPTGDLNNHNAIVGGDSNCISGKTSFSIIGGGRWNQINLRLTAVTDNSQSGIFSGWYNTIQTPSSVICGGWSNQTLGDFAHRGAFIGGGTLYPTDRFDAVLSGGGNNHVASDWGTIVGGSDNSTSLPLQVVGGYFNATRGSFPATFADALNATTPGSNVPPATPDAYNTPLFMLGNGKTGANHNAFEVSYNGHSTVTDINLTGGASGGTPPFRPALKGTTYVDNIIYAWGDVNGNGTTNADFGVSTVAHIRVGVYIVTLNLRTPGVPPTAFNLANASITATLVDNTNFMTDPTNACGTIVVSRIGGAGLGPNQFLVRTFNNSGPSAPGDCTIADRAFMFKVTGR